MAGDWQVQLNPDIIVVTDGTRCRIGGVVSVSFELDEVEFVWSEIPDQTIEQRGLLSLRLKGRPGVLASIRLSRQEAQQVRTMLEAGERRLH